MKKEEEEEIQPCSPGECAYDVHDDASAVCCCGMVSVVVVLKKQLNSPF